MKRKSISDYPANWTEIAKAVKNKANWMCIRCSHPHDPAAGYCLTVHHLDLSPANCRWWNLAALCQRCHLQIQAKVVMERVWLFDHTPWFRPYVAGYYAFHYNLPDDEISVLANIEALIALGQGRTTVTELEAR